MLIEWDQDLQKNLSDQIRETIDGKEQVAIYR
jgi:hypothetical protein